MPFRFGVSFSFLEAIYLTSSPAPQHHLECLSVRGQYRPNCAPNTESAVGSHVRPSRQSRDCLLGRPFRAPVLSVMVRSALGSVLPTHVRARWRFSSHPHSANAIMFGVRLHIHAHMRSQSLGWNTIRRPAPRLCTRMRNPASLRWLCPRG